MTATTRASQRPAVMDDLLTTLKLLETALHDPDVRRDPSRLSLLLHDDFHETGRSGREYNRADILRALGAEARAPAIVADGYSLQILAPGAALLRYRSAHRRHDGGVERPTLRSSVWVWTDDRWQLLHHQGTPADASA